MSKRRKRTSAKRMVDMSGTKRPPKTADEWFDILNRVVGEFHRYVDAQGMYEGPLQHFGSGSGSSGVLTEIINTLELDTAPTSVYDRLVAIGWVQDCGRVEGTVSTRRWFLRRDPIPRGDVTTADYKVRQQKRRERADLLRRRASAAAAVPVPAPEVRLDQDQLVRGKQVVVVTPKREPITAPEVRTPEVEPQTAAELHAQEIAMLEAEIAKVTKERDDLAERFLKVREQNGQLVTEVDGLRRELNDHRLLIEGLLDPAESQMVKLAIKYERLRHEEGQ